jgi:hypothetical protein
MRVERSKSKKGKGLRIPAKAWPSGRVKFEIYGEEMIDKEVRPSGASGRVYLPPDWVNRHVKIIRVGCRWGEHGRNEDREE